MFEAGNADPQPLLPLPEGAPSRSFPASYMSQEAMADTQWMVATVLQLPQEVLAVEVIEFLQVPKNDTPLSPQVLGQIGPLHLREVTRYGIVQGANVLLLRPHHLINDVSQFAAGRKRLQNLQPLLMQAGALKLHSKYYPL